MLPTESFYIYFYVLLGGFMTVWTFRKSMGSMGKISEFEYIGFSAFWGIALIATYESLSRISPPPSDMFQNPLASGFVLSLMGMVGAVFIAEICKMFLWVHKHGWHPIINIIMRPATKNDQELL